jgi:hypothetical protein
MKRIYSVTFLLAISVSVFCQDLTQGLVLYLPFSNSLTDASGNGATVTKFLASGGQVNYTYDRKSNLNQALLFSSNAAINLNVSNGALSFGTSTSFNMSFWFMTNDQNEIDFFYGTDAPYYKGVSLIANEFVKGQFDFIIRASFLSDQAELLYTNTALLDNQWHHLSVNVNRGTSVIDLYIDAVKVKSVSFSGKVPDATPQTLSDNGMGSWYDGKLDEVRFYSRVLSQAEINILAGKANPTGVSSLIVSGMPEIINPVMESMEIKYLSDEDAITEIVVTDLMGRVVNSIQVDNKNMLVLPFISCTGLYYVTITTRKGYVFNHKVIHN